MQDKEEYLAECKRRAIWLLDAGDPAEAMTSILSELSHHPDTADHPGIQIGIGFMLLPGWLDNTREVRRFIEGFR
jgi:hypothetical protein